jgi:aminopeptidase
MITGQGRMDVMPSDRLERYAELVVRIGLNVQPGQVVRVSADLSHAPVARAVVEQAYFAGASRVSVDYSDDLVRRSTLRHAPMETLTEHEPWQLERLRGWGREGAALLTLTGNPDPHVFDAIDPARLAAVPMELAVESRRLTLGGGVSWCVVAAPNPGWATQVFGEPDEERLWAAVSIAMRLDEPDVVEAWREHRAQLQKRSAALELLDLDTVRYHGDGTDLTVGIIPGARWVSGSLTTRSGVEFMPNLPTEEVFTSPDRSRADGSIALTRPLVLPGAGVLVEDLVVHFEAGRITDVSARTGADAVRAQLDSDEGARSLGEVSLVDGSSRVRAAGVVFHDTLYDENAGCHVAWGQGFPFALADGLELTGEQLFGRGINTSSVHTDVVIGGPGVHVEGRTRNGQVVPIITDDAWVLPVLSP